VHARFGAIHALPSHSIFSAFVVTPESDENDILLIIYAWFHPGKVKSYANFLNRKISFIKLMTRAKSGARNNATL